MISALPAQLHLEPSQFLGIPLALLGAVFLSLGAQLQNRGVGRVESDTQSAKGKGLSIKQIGLLLARPSWVLGSALLGIAIVLQLASLYFSPIIVVQPLGAIALVLTAIIHTRVSGKPLNRGSVIAVAMCVGGVFLFVGVAAFNTTNQPIDTPQLITILALLFGLLGALGLVFGFFRHRISIMFYVLGAGVLYGFVATLAKVVLARVQQGNFEWLTAICVVALIAATALGAYFVQNAYSSGPPDMVIAGLTVIDPMVAVTIGVAVLGEAAFAPLWAVGVFIFSGALAVSGVFLLSRHHPELSESAESRVASK
ncbi:MAG TPA: DMT family transporter [Microbacteriaceae bacterium]|nr:DMT family transporter [Microbacteriaceae bacterium]